MDPLGQLHDDLYNAGIPMFSKHGTYLSREEREDMARRQGLCERCGVKTMKGRIRKQPITDDKVYKGICIKCFPSKVPVTVVEAYEMRNPRAMAAPVVVSAAGAATPAPVSRPHPTPAITPSRPAARPQPTARPQTSARSRTHHLPGVARAVQAQVAMHGRQNSHGAGTNDTSVPLQRSLTISDTPISRPTRGQRSNTIENPYPSRPIRGSKPSMDSSTGGLPSRSATLVGDVPDRPGDDKGEGSAMPPRRGTRPPLEDYTGGVKSAQEREDDPPLKGLRQHQNNPDLVKKYLHRLRNEGGGYDDFNGAGMGEIFEVMNHYGGDTRIMAVACGSIWRLSSMEIDQKIQAAETGILETLIELISREENYRDVDFIEWAIGAITSMGQVAENKGFIAEKGGIEFVIDAMKQISSPGVFEWSCRCLHALIHESEDDLPEDKRAIQAVIEKNVISIFDCDGLSVITSAMSHNTRDAIALRWAIKLIWRLLDHSDSSIRSRGLRKMMDANFVDVAVKILKARSTSSSPELFRGMVELLCTILQSPGHNDSMLQLASQSISGTIRSMERDYKDNSEILECCCRLLTILASGSREARHLVQESHGAQVILDAMDKFTDNVELAESGTWAFWIMSSGDIFFRDVQLLRSVSETIKRAAEMHRSSAELLYPVCGYIGNVCVKNNVDPSTIPMSTIVGALDVLQDHPEGTKEAQRAIANIFTKFPNIAENHGDALEDENVLNNLVDSAKNPQSMNKSLLGLLSTIAAQSPGLRKTMVDEGMVSHFVTQLIESDDSSCYMPMIELLAILVGEKSKSLRLPDQAFPSIVRAAEVNATSPDMMEKVCVLMRNLLLASSSRPGMDGLVEYVTGIINSPNGSAELKMEACGVLWALTAKFPNQRPEALERMFNSVLGAVITYKQPYHVGLQDVAVGALCCITSSARSNPFPVATAHIDELVSLPYTALDCDPGGIEQFEKLLDVILNLAYLDEFAIVQGGVIVVVIDTMAEFEQNPAIQETGCAILALLASTENLQVNLSIVQTDGIDMLINALALFAGNANVEKQACKALSHLSIDQESRILISSLGGIMLLGNTMRGNINDQGLLEGCCTALLNLSSDADDALLLGCNIIEIMIDVMRQHPDSASLQENGMGILQNVSMRSLEAKKAIADAGGINAITAAIQEHMSTPSVLERAFTTLWSLAVLDLNQPVIADANGIALVVNGMLAAISYETVQKQGCGCLCTLSSNSYNKGTIQNIGGVDSIVYAMWVHYSSEDIQIEACRALSSLAVDVHTNEVMIASEGEVNAIVSAMRRFPNSERLQEHACVALRNFLLSVDNVEVFRGSEPEVREAVSCAASLFPHSCSERANQVLSSLG